MISNAVCSIVLLTNKLGVDLCTNHVHLTAAQANLQLFVKYVQNTVCSVKCTGRINFTRDTLRAPSDLKVVPTPTSALKVAQHLLSIHYYSSDIRATHYLLSMSF